jgi:hypothetical protein
MGEPRWNILESQLPSTAIVLGIDEHTACIVRVDENRCEVRGIGQVTVRRQGADQVFVGGDTFDLDLLRSTGSFASLALAETVEADNPSWDGIRDKHEQLLAAHNPSPEATTGYIYDLLAFLSAARERGDAQTMRLAEEAMREALVGIVAQLGAAPSNTEELIGPYVDLLIELRTSLRSARQWEQADQIRQRLTDLGILLEDSPQGTQWKQQ